MGRYICSYVASVSSNFELLENIWFVWPRLTDVLDMLDTLDALDTPDASKTSDGVKNVTDERTNGRTDKVILGV